MKLKTLLEKCLSENPPDAKILYEGKRPSLIGLYLQKAKPDILDKEMYFSDGDICYSHKGFFGEKEKVLLRMRNNPGKRGWVSPDSGNMKLHYIGFNADLQEHLSFCGKHSWGGYSRIRWAEGTIEEGDCCKTCLKKLSAK